MSLEVHTSKMNSEFWPPRGPPSNPSSNNFQSMMDTTNDYHHQRNQQAASGFHNNNNNSSANDNNNGVVDMKDHLIAGQEGQNSFNQSQSGFQLNQQPAPPTSPGTENSSPESKFNSEKFVNDIQVSWPSPQPCSTARLLVRKVFWRQKSAQEFQSARLKNHRRK